MRKATRLFGRWKRGEEATTMRILESDTKAGTWKARAGIQYGIKARKQCESQRRRKGGNARCRREHAEKRTGEL